jgi:ATP-dependent Clp protease ATP-binding subunit ClpX
MFLPLLESAARMKDNNTPAASSARTGVSSVLKRDDIAEVAELASTGVILLDEFDKWMRRVNHHTGRLDTAIQAELLKMIEGSQVYISDSEDEAGLLFDTSKVLVLCAGAFVGLVSDVLKRQGRAVEDLQAAFQTLIEQNLIEQGDFVRYGVIPELAGRLSKMVFLRPLQKQDLSVIIRAPGGVVDELRQRFEAVGCQWAVPDVAVMYMADVALRKEVGARGIDTVVWQVFHDALFRASVAEHPTTVSLAVNQVRAELRAA